MAEVLAELRELFCEAMDIASPSDRSAYLDRACAGKPELRLRLDALLGAHQQADGFLRGAAAETVALQPAGREGRGTLLGSYTLLEQLGEGGFGLVFRAEQQQPVRRQVAVKILKPGMDSRQVVARFEAERQALALMDHPNIAKVLDAGETSTGRPYFVMELFRGLPITEYCDRHVLDARARLELFVKVCQAVQHAHQKGIIHRDLKPSNLLVAEQDGAGVVKVIDFGIVKALGHPLTDRTLLTSVAQLVGTPMYMSPEQASISADIDTRSDIYSLGVVLYELLTGAPPFSKERLREASFDEMRRILREEEPPRPSTLVGTMRESAATVASRRKSDPKRLTRLLRGDLDWIVMKALEKERTRRYETASALAADVEHFLHDEPVTASPPSAWYRFRKLARRQRAALTMAAVVAISLVFVVAALGIGIGWSARDHAAREAALNVEVNRAVEEAGTHIDASQWTEAEGAVERAQKLLASAGHAEVPERLLALRNDLSLVRRLEEIYERIFDWDALTGTARQHAIEVCASYARVFQDFGLEIAGKPWKEAAASIKVRHVRVELARALDAWSRQSYVADPQAEDWKRLLDVAKAVDPDPWRDRLRDALKIRDRSALEALAASANPRELPPGTLLILGTSLIDAGARGKGLTLLREGNRQYPGDLRLLDELGVNCRKDDPGVDEAARCFAAALALRPRSPYFTYQLGLTLGLKKSYREAIELYSKVLELEPTHTAALIGRGHYFSLINQNHLAIADYSRALTLVDPRYKWAVQAARGRAYVGLERWEDAIAEFSKVLAVKPDNAPLWFERAQAYAILGQWDKAAQNLAKAVDLRPQEHSWLEALAAYCARAGDVKGYREACKAMVSQFASTKVFWIAQRVALCCLLTDELEDRKLPTQLAESALAMGGNDKWCQATWGFALLRNGKVEEGAKQVRTLALGFGNPKYAASKADGLVVMTWLLAALAEGTRGEAMEASAWFAKAASWMDQEMLEMNPAALRKQSFIWAICQVLRGEVVALVGSGTQPK